MKKFLIAAPLALAAATALVTPAQAATNWNNPGQIRSEIAQLDRQVDRLHGISPREEQRLERQVDQLQRLYQSYARGGFSRTELQRLGNQVSAVKAQIYAQANDRNGRNDRNDHGRTNHR